MLYKLFFVEVDHCLRLRWTCENGGQAVDTGKSCECQCAAGYTGEHCQIGALDTAAFCLQFEEVRRFYAALCWGGGGLIITANRTAENGCSTSILNLCQTHKCDVVG